MRDAVWSHEFGVELKSEEGVRPRWWTKWG